MKYRIRILLPGSREVWLSLKPDDAELGAVALHSRHTGATIEYCIAGESAGDLKSLANDVLRCYAAVTSVAKELSKRQTS